MGERYSFSRVERKFPFVQKLVYSIEKEQHKFFKIKKTSEDAVACFDEH